MFNSKLIHFLKWSQYLIHKNNINGMIHKELYHAINITLPFSEYIFYLSVNRIQKSCYYNLRLSQFFHSFSLTKTFGWVLKNLVNIKHIWNIMMFRQIFILTF